MTADAHASEASPEKIHQTPCWRARLARSLLAAALAVLLVAAIDAHWARSVVDAPFGLLWLADVGLLMPLALVIGAASGLAAVALHPEGPLTFDSAGKRVERSSLDERWRVAVLLALSPLGIVVGTVWLAQAAFRLLAVGASPVAIGAALGVVATLIGAIVALCVSGASRTVRDLNPKGAPPLAAAAALGFALAVAVFTYGTLSGSTSGEGGFFQILGVLKRQELDLRPVGLVLPLALAGYLLPGLLGRVSGVLALVGALALSALLVFPAYGLKTGPSANALERGAPLGHLVLAPLRRLSDDDKDGFSDRFGGGDCRDDNATISPGADDLPENGIDEDCSGADDPRIELEEPEEDVAKEASGPGRSVPKQLGLVLITVDTLRYDLGYTGYGRPISPNIDRLATDSVIFEKAYSLASYTGKSVGPMLIGKYTSETHRGWSHFNSFGAVDTFVQERLRKAGIRTLTAQGHYYFSKNSGLTRGFDVEDHSAAPRVPQMEGDTTVNSGELTDAAISLLSKPENVGERFYLWVHYLDPHANYVPHEEFDFGKKGRDLYDGEVAFTDKHVGRLLDFIRNGPLAARTAIILTSDHGEAFGEHGMYRHGFELWEELIRVPLLVHVPGVDPHRVTVRRSAIDLVPTIVDLFALEEATGVGDDFVSGVSLSPDIFMPPGHTAKTRIVFSDMSAGPYNTERQAFIENDMKLVAVAGAPVSLFDLAKDPEEKTNLLIDESIAKPITQRYKAFRRELRVVPVKPR